MRRIFLAVIAAGLLVAPAGLVAEASVASAATAGTKAVNWPVVRQGAKGERVRVIQGLLKERGATVVIDGTYGAATTTAVKAFQRKSHLAVDGFVGPATWPKLVVTLAKGARGAAVGVLQHQLRFQYGYKTVAVDGVFGASTQAAVKNFQGKHGVGADGIVGQATWKALEA